MRKRFVAAFLLGLGLVVASAGSVRADPYTAYFTVVHDKVVALRDALVDPLTKQQAKRKALLDKILAALDTVSVSLQTDLQTGRAVAAAVVKGFIDDPDLPDVVLALLTNLEGDVKAHLDELTSRLAALPDSKLKAKAQKLLAKVTSPLRSADKAELARDLKSIAGSLFKADAATGPLEQALKKAEAASGIACLGGHGTATATLDGTAFPIDPARIGGTLSVFCPTPQRDPNIAYVLVDFFSPSAPPGGHAGPLIHMDIDVANTGSQFHGADSYAVGPHEVGFGQVSPPAGDTFVSDTGTLALTTFELDVATKHVHIAGTLDFVTSHDATVVTYEAHAVHVQFDITCLAIVNYCHTAK